LRDGNGSSRDGFDFLIGRNLDQATFERARMLAARWSAPLHTILINTGWVRPEDYVRRLAQALGVPAAVGTAFDERAFAPVDATATSPETVARAVSALAAAGRRPILVSDYRPPPPDHGERQRAHVWNAIDGLHHAMPEASAKGRTWLWQKIVFALLAGTAIGLSVTDTALAYFLLTWVAAVPFALIVAQRLAVLACAVCAPVAPPNGQHASPIGDHELPTYTILVPLFREADVLPDLIAALHAIDYPAAKLDILLILEESDLETRARAAEITLPQFMRVVVVPDAQPRTKPKAMNYALRFARGSFVAVYDAEDIPDPLQLRRAIAVFRSSSARLGCIQARLNIYNRRTSWFSRGLMAQTPPDFRSLPN
jgi:glycosyltransferase XagB